MGILRVYFQERSWYQISICAWISLIRILQQSGSPMKIPSVLEMQHYFDDLVNTTNCTDAKDRLGCLRVVPYSQLIQAVNLQPNMLSYPSMKLAWQPMIDGSLIPRNPLQILQSGKYARVSTRPLQDVLFPWRCTGSFYHRWLRRRGDVSIHLNHHVRCGFTCHFISLFSFALLNITWVVINFHISSADISAEQMPSSWNISRHSWASHPLQRFATYFHSPRYFPTITDAELTALAAAYPDDITQVNHYVATTVRHLF
jgi:hypothetical protein